MIRGYGSCGGACYRYSACEDFFECLADVLGVGEVLSTWFGDGDACCMFPCLSVAAVLHQAVEKV